VADQLVLISVPYTGTNFTLGLFAAEGFEPVPLNKPVAGKVIYQGHMTSGNQVRFACELAASRPLVIPLRHPFRACESARRRGASVGSILAAYRTFSDVFLPMSPYLLPVDSVRRDCYLGRLREEWPGLATDWGVVGSHSGTSDLELKDCQPSQAEIDLVEELETLLSPIYAV
jgi:hypothetical protein